MASFVDLIHGVDSEKLLNEINKQAEKHQRIINCLLQIKIAQEDTKFGMTAEAAHTLLASDRFKTLKNIAIVGLMGMASFTEDTAQIREEFTTLKNTFDSLKNTNPSLEIISMGMSGDYPLAIECGSTMVRLGSSIFGARNYAI
jgi:pyridoxal phosphate enzyme (YggS family)